MRYDKKVYTILVVADTETAINKKQRIGTRAKINGCRGANVKFITAKTRTQPIYANENITSEMPRAHCKPGHSITNACNLQKYSISPSGAPFHLLFSSARLQNILS